MRKYDVPRPDTTCAPYYVSFKSITATTIVEMATNADRSPICWSCLENANRMPQSARHAGNAQTATYFMSHLPQEPSICALEHVPHAAPMFIANGAICPPPVDAMIAA
jgi:hypothetical protein